MQTVRLFTKSGWECLTECSTHSSFFDLLSNLKEATGSLPEELELQGSVAEVIEDEWEAYSQVMNKSTNLKSIQRITNIVTLPKKWRTAVYVTRETSQVDRVHHIKEQAKVTHMRDESDDCPLAKYLIRGYIHLITSMEELEPEQKRDAIKLIEGLLWNMWLQGGNWLDILWEDIDLLLADVPMNEGNRARVTSSSNLILGRGEINSRAMSIGRSKFSVSKGGFCRIFAGTDIHILYDRLLAAYPADVSPIGLGLEPIINGGKTSLTHNYTKGKAWKEMRLEGIVPWFNYNTLLLGIWFSSIYRKVECIRASLDQHRFPRSIELLDVSTVGRTGLLRIIDCLDRYTKNDKYKKNKRIESFLSLARKRVESVPDPIERRLIAKDEP